MVGLGTAAYFSQQLSILLFMILEDILPHVYTKGVGTVVNFS